MSDLQSLLDSRDTGAVSAGFAATNSAAAPTVAASETVIDADRWTRRRGESIAEQWTSEGIADHAPALVTDCHASLFEPQPALADNPSDKQRAEWFKQMMDSPEYRSIHNQTMLQSELSALASKALADQWKEYAAQLPDANGPDAQPGGEGESIRDSVKRVRSIGKALKDAAETVQDCADISAGLGLGSPGSPIDQTALANAFKAVRSDKLLRDILKLAGRMISFTQALQRTKVIHGRDDVIGIECSDDIARVLPSELAELACGIPEVELAALYRLANAEMLSYRYRGVQRAARGPIVVVVDESGSMGCDDNKPIIAAKAMALALAWLARQQRRWIALIGFAGGSDGNCLACPPGKTDQSALIEWATHFYGGGTTLDVPLDQLPRVYWPRFVEQGLQRGKTDVVILTDAIVDAPAEMITAYNVWAKAEQVATYGIILESAPGDLAKVCTRTWCIESLDMDSPALASVLSI